VCPYSSPETDSVLTECTFADRLPSISRTFVYSQPQVRLTRKQFLSVICIPQGGLAFNRGRSRGGCLGGTPCPVNSGVHGVIPGRLGPSSGISPGRARFPGTSPFSLTVPGRSVKHPGNHRFREAPREPFQAVTAKSLHFADFEDEVHRGRTAEAL
jgi:hypothetical protein